ncbi:MAG TPA: gamma-glutamyltransferase [Gaiellaceae bacterium]|jgi:gamma-glutamyltranspeptidase/glutathione hydrolase|nr:gamma-glutamyltransferase [Gaiellaceae bacterium]
MPPGVAAGHPATAEAGLRILEEGGSAADAAVAASLASCVAETVMTGLAGGGHAIWFDGKTGETRLLDFFVTVPKVHPDQAVAPLDDVGVPFGNEIVHYQVGIASCAVPGVPAGLDELWTRHGRLAWARIVEPALELARSGVDMPPAHAACLAMLAPVMTLREGARIYSPGGELLEAGDRLDQPGLANALELMRDEGARTFYEGTIAETLVALMHEREGPVSRGDLESYQPLWLEPVGTDYLGLRVLTRGGLSQLVTTLSALPTLRGMPPAERALTLARVLEALPYSGQGEQIGDTTNLVAVDPDGNACVMTTSLGLGSGHFLPGLDIHLNSMLGEVDLQVRPLEPGSRMESMMSPSLVVDDEGLVIAAGAAGGTRLRPALVQVLSGILDEELQPQAAVDRPRLHSAGEIVRLEPGFDDDTLLALAGAGYDVRRFDALHHYFGGVSLLARTGAAADPRRSGAALALP